MDSSIEIKSLSVEKAGRKILNNISVALPSGKIIGLLGPSGAGKTTLIRTLVGRQSISRGTINVFGIPAGSSKLRQILGYMPQSPACYQDLTVSQNLNYFASMKGRSRTLVEEVLQTVDLAKQSNQLVNTLSGGQKSRVSLAIALLGKPKLLFLDEPTVGVDPVLRQQLWQIFRELAESGTTLLVSSHVMEEASHCDYLLLIRDGEILSFGTPKELEEKTQTSNIEESFLKLIGSNE